MLLYWLVAAIAFVDPARSQCGDVQYDMYYVNECPYYYDLLEAALLNESAGNLYRLQRAFFPDKSSPSVTSMDILVTINVNTVVNESCELWPDSGPTTFGPCTGGCSWDSTYTLQVGSSLQLLGSIASEIFATSRLYEGIIALPSAYELSSTSYQEVDIDLYLDHLSCNPEKKSTEDVVIYLLSWLKEYAINNGRPETWDDDNRGEVDKSDNYLTVPEEHASVQNLVLVIYVLLNVSVMLVMVRITSSLYNQLVKKLSEETQLNRLYCTVYWGGSTTLFFFSIVLFLADVYVLVVFCLIFTDYFFSKIEYPLLYGFSVFATLPSAIAHFGTVFLVKVISIAVGIVVCILVCKRSRNGIQIPFASFRNIFCCCCCRCCSQSVKYKAVQALALWGIMSFVQHLTMSAIPIFCLLILIPGETISMLALCLSALFCIIMLVSHVLYMCRFFGSRKGCHGHRFRAESVAMFLAQMLLIVFLLSTVIAVAVLYIVVVKYGAGVNSFRSIFVSLIPSVILSVIGWFVKKKLMQSSTKTLRNDTYEDLEAGATSADEQSLLIQN